MATLSMTQDLLRSIGSGNEAPSPAQDRLARGLGWFSIGLGVAELVAPDAIGRLIGARNNSGLIRAYGLREIAAGAGILAAEEPGRWLWSRVAGDVLDLASLGRMLGSPESDRAKAAFGIASVAAVTVLDVICARHHTAKSQPDDGDGSVRAETSLIVNRPPEDCYRFWRDLQNLPKFMVYIESVRLTGDRQSHWVANVAGKTFEWDAEIEADVPNQRIAWHSLPGADITNSGSVEFVPATGGRGTIVRVQAAYGSSLHALASAIATMAGKDPEQMINKELRRFKQMVEVGEVLTTEGQPAGRSDGVTWLDRIAR